ncbi:MAG: DUF1127 domain-containing protein [Rhodospirillaceae bacterium]|nr:DUF1127 domain-containing protein [Rhodospirillaceae bacterium]
MGTTVTQLARAGMMPARASRLGKEALTEHARVAERRRVASSGIERWMHRFAASIHEQREAQRLFRELRTYDDHLLKDIGFTREGLWRQIREAVRQR